jgi:hypothetical protein
VKLIFIFFVSASVFAQQSTCRPPGARFPIVDQDGLGVCASAAASILLQHNVAGMTNAPSYLALSITSSYARANSFVTPDGDSFVDSNHVCSVVNSTATGYCDSRFFPMDFVGRDDRMNSQETSLVNLGRLLEANQPAIQNLKRQFADPARRPEAIQRIATILFQDSQVCRVDRREYLAKSMLARVREDWRRRLPTLPAGQRPVMQAALNRTFLASGEPTRAALEYAYENFFKSDYATVLNRDASNPSRSPTQIAGMTYPEGIFGFHWGFRLGLESGSFLGYSSSPATIRNDWARFSGCDENATTKLISTYLRDPFCPISPSIPEEFTNLASRMAMELSDLSSDPQLDIIGMIAPLCANQIRRGQKTRGLECNYIRINNPETQQAAIRKAREELCSGRAFTIDVCGSMMESPTVLYRNHCPDSRSDHAMAVIDVRQGADGKTRYLVQNSWGRTCKFADGDVERPVYAGIANCVRGADGVFTGRFWVEEEFLFNNSKAMSTLKSN